MKCVIIKLPRITLDSKYILSVSSGIRHTERANSTSISKECRVVYTHVVVILASQDALI